MKWISTWYTSNRKTDESIWLKHRTTSILSSGQLSVPEPSEGVALGMPIIRQSTWKKSNSTTGGTAFPFLYSNQDKLNFINTCTICPKWLHKPLTCQNFSFSNLRGIQATTQTKQSQVMMGNRTDLVFSPSCLTMSHLVSLSYNEDFFSCILRIQESGAFFLPFYAPWHTH